MAKRYSVQFIHVPIECDSSSLLIEQLRYARVLSIVKEEEGNGQEGTRIRVLKLYPPKGYIAKIWAEQNVARMQSFGINATVIEERG